MELFQRKNYGLISILALSFLPVLLWISAASPLPRFSSFTVAMANIGQIAGLVGTAMFALSLILSARFTFWEKYFNGLNVLYNRHNELGQIAFILLLFHPLLLIPKYAGSSLYAAYVFLAPTANWPQNWGWFSLILMIILLVLTLFLRPKYSIWKWTHKFLGLAFFLAVLHIWFIPSDTSRNIPLRAYMLALSAAGLAVFSYKSILGSYFIRKYKYYIMSVRLLNNLVFEIVMAPEEGQRMKFIAGQFAFFSFLDKNFGSESHPFSIASSPEEENLTIVVKNLGDHTADFGRLAMGSWVRIEGPYGIFSYKNTDRKKQVWIAGGIGITPFLGMAKTLKPEENYDIDLYYCVRNTDEAVLLDTLEKISSFMNNSFRVIKFCSEDLGYHINAEAIEGASGPLKEKDIFLCAPPAMIYSLKKQFADMGIGKKFIHSEEFSF